MKNKIILLAIYSLFTCILYSCKEELKLGDKPSIDNIEYTVEAMAKTPNVVQFSFSSQLLSPLWSIEKPDGSFLRSNRRSFTVEYLMAGEYNGTVQAYGQGGLSDSIHFVFSVPENSPLVTKLTGHNTQKTWVWNSTVKGHLTGVWTDPNGAWEGKWEVEPGELSSFNIYDDELIFLAKNNEYVLNSNGFVYVEQSALSIMDPVNYPNGGSSATSVAYTQPKGQKWTLYQNDAGKFFLNFSDMAFPSYVASPKALGTDYEIVELTDNHLHLRWEEAAPDVITSWHYHFILK